MADRRSKRPFDLFHKKDDVPLNKPAKGGPRVMSTNAVAKQEEIVTATAALVLQIASALVDKPDEIVLDLEISHTEVEMILSVAPLDRQNVLGIQATTFLAIRAILASVNRRTRYQFRLELAGRDDNTK